MPPKASPVPPTCRIVVVARPAGLAHWRISCGTGSEGVPPGRNVTVAVVLSLTSKADPGLFGMLPVDRHVKSHTSAPAGVARASNTTERTTKVPIAEQRLHGTYQGDSSC